MRRVKWCWEFAEARHTPPRVSITKRLRATARDVRRKRGHERRIAVATTPYPQSLFSTVGHGNHGHDALDPQERPANTSLTSPRMGMSYQSHFIQSFGE